MNINSAIQSIRSGAFDETLRRLYPSYDSDPAKYQNRVVSLLETYREKFGETDDIHLFSAPGRVEVGGNHTDHQHGCVLAAAVDRDAIAAAALNGTNVIHSHSIGYGDLSIDLGDLSIHEDEKDSTAALIRGTAAIFSKDGVPVTGFNVCITSDVPGGSGMSSSAAFEVLMGEVINGLFANGSYSPVTIALYGQQTERNYFGKPSGCMDQMASAVGGFVAIDFKDNEHPVIEAVSADELGAKYKLFVVDSGSAHDDLTAEYAGIPNENKLVSAYFGKDVLREVDPEQFWANIKEIRAKAGDRAILRAIHFYEDHQRAQDEAAALKKGDIDGFLKLIRESGLSSFTHLQNVVISGHKEHQEVAYALAACEHALNGEGAVRVHGGGFAGTVLAFVPADKAEEFEAEVERCIFKGACRKLSIRPAGCAQVF